jgi:hypothetical protein
MIKGTSPITSIGSLGNTSKTYIKILENLGEINKFLET